MANYEELLEPGVPTCALALPAVLANRLGGSALMLAPLILKVALALDDALL